MGLLSDFRQWDDEVATPWLKEKAAAVDDWAYNHVPGYAPFIQPWARDGVGGLLQQTDSALHGKGFSPQAVTEAVLEMAPGNAIVGAGAVRNVAGPVLGMLGGKIGKVLPYQRVAREIDADSLGHVNVRAIKDHLSSHGDFYELNDIPISRIADGQLDGIDPSLARDIGPIVVDADGMIVDGRHRAASALQRGDKTIPAYIPKSYSR